MNNIITNAINGDTFKCLFETLIRDHAVEFHADNDMRFEYGDDYSYKLIITIEDRKFVVNRAGDIVKDPLLLLS